MTLRGTRLTNKRAYADSSIAHVAQRSTLSANVLMGILSATDPMAALTLQLQAKHAADPFTQTADAVLNAAEAVRWDASPANALALCSQVAVALKGGCMVTWTPPYRYLWRGYVYAVTVTVERGDELRKITLNRMTARECAALTDALREAVNPAEGVQA